MNNYSKPIVLANEELAEGVYAASGAGCYTAWGEVFQNPATGFDEYRVKIHADHKSDNHHSTEQVAYVTFNKAVKYLGCNATSGTYLKGGDGTTTLQIGLFYHKNAVEPFEFADLRVMTVDGSRTGLTVEKVEVACNYDCDQHNYLPNYPY